MCNGVVGLASFFRCHIPSVSCAFTGSRLIHLATMYSAKCKEEKRRNPFRILSGQTATPMLFRLVRAYM
ncbi:hypothetical protein MGSAQ_001974 [marine sediment metagenome]|uniref:Uncharacterized protein n=1 Tax=marine sediment metagenome TaxID=412755 RepID=A0A1B6NSU7_9ZZZZ